MDYRNVAGLDLGQVGDPTALVILGEWQPEVGDAEHVVRYMKRWPLGTSYVQVCEEVREILEKVPGGIARMAVDYTGVGRPFVDMLLSHGVTNIVPISITSGNESHFVKETQSWSVPKKELVSVVQKALGKRTLKVVPTLNEARTLERELIQFQMKITSAANEVYGAWREGQHDDLVLAVAVAEWTMTRIGTGMILDLCRSKPRPVGVLENAPDGVFGAASKGKIEWPD